jgi:hypothetical protein
VEGGPVLPLGRPEPRLTIDWGLRLPMDVAQHVAVHDGAVPDKDDLALEAEHATSVLALRVRRGLRITWTRLLDWPAAFLISPLFNACRTYGENLNCGSENTKVLTYRGFDGR